MTPALQMANPAPKGRLWRSAVCDLAAFLAVPGALTALAYFHTPVLAANIALVAIILARLWLTREVLKLLLVDYVVLAIAASSLLRLLFGGGNVGVQRAAALFAGVLLYWVIRTVKRRLLLVRWTLFSVGMLGALLAAYSIFGTRAWIVRGEAAGFDDVTALKGALVSVLGGPINEWATVLGLRPPEKVL